MRWYRTVKRIGGREYIYEQRTYREGGEVRTESRYLAPVAPVDRVIAVTSNEPINTSVEIAIVDNTTPPADDAEETVEDGINTTKKERPSPLKIRADLAVSKVSGKSLEMEHRRMCRHLKRLGLDGDNTPRILVVHGREATSRRRLTGGYKVTLPRSGKRTAFKREYRKALAGVWLDEVRRQNPVMYDRLKTAMHDEYRATKWALTRYFLSTKTKRKYALTLQIMWSNKLPVWYRSQLKPEVFGLTDHDAHTSWRDDATGLMVEISQRGIKSTEAKYKAVERRAYVACNREGKMLQAMCWRDSLSGRKRAQHRAYKRALARLRAANAARSKLAILRGVFGKKYRR